VCELLGPIPILKRSNTPTGMSRLYAALEPNPRLNCAVAGRTGSSGAPLGRCCAGGVSDAPALMSSLDSSLRTGFWILAQRCGSYYLATRTGLGAVFSRQQGLPLLSSARGPRFHSAARAPPGTGGPTRWPRLPVITSPHSRRAGHRSTHSTARSSTPCRMSSPPPGSASSSSHRSSRITLREAVYFVLIAVIIVPVGTAFWGGRLHGLQWLWNSLLGSNGATSASRME
jgi:hypothetical protein